MPDPKNEGVRNTFARQAIPMTWDFAETNPFSSSSGSWELMVRGIGRVLDGQDPRGHGHAVQSNAMVRKYKNCVVSTDPPYYDNIIYSDLSDFFYVWLRRSLRTFYPELTGTMLTPKTEELVATPYRFKGDKKAADRYFEDGLASVFERIRLGHHLEVPMTVYYAFKQTESHGEADTTSTGWETMLEGLLRAGFAITATWPIRTERTGRSVDIGTNALASSIVLACRSREADAGVTDRRGLIAALREELPEALRTLQQGSIAPVDLSQAAIGPGIAVFSRFARVNEPDGSAMRVRTALALINQVLDEVLSEQEGDFGRDTRWCLEWFKSYGFDDGPFGSAETLSKAKNTSIHGLEGAGVLRSRAGKVRLLSVDDLPEGYDPAADDRVSEWEITLHLAKRLHEHGGEEAARLMLAARAAVDLDAVRELAYLLFSIAEKRGWGEISRLFNGLGTSWSDLAETSRKPGLASVNVQGQLGYEAE
jgi:putative DNA methylase